MSCCRGHSIAGTCERPLRQLAKESRVADAPIMTGSPTGARSMDQQHISQDDGIVVEFITSGVDERDPAIAREVAQSFELIRLLVQLRCKASAKLLPSGGIGERLPQMCHVEHDGHIVHTGSIIKEAVAKRAVTGTFSLMRRPGIIRQSPKELFQPIHLRLFRGRLIAGFRRNSGMLRGTAFLRRSPVVSQRAMALAAS